MLAFAGGIDYEELLHKGETKDTVLLAWTIFSSARLMV